MFGGMTCSERWQLMQLQFKVGAMIALQANLYDKILPKENHSKLLKESTKRIEKMVLKEREDIKNLKKLAEEERESNEDFFKVFGLDKNGKKIKKNKEENV